MQEHNEEAAGQARDFVLSLDLPDANLDFIEDSCLAELDEISSATNYELTSYTVCVPKGALQQNKSNSSVDFNDLTYYGTYNNRDFYFYYYSESSRSTEYKKTSTREKEWWNNAIDLILCFADANITVPITLVKQAMGIPSGYTPNNQAYCDYYFI